MDSTEILIHQSPMKIKAMQLQMTHLSYIHMIEYINKLIIEGMPQSKQISKLNSSQCFEMHHEIWYTFSRLIWKGHCSSAKLTLQFSKIQSFKPKQLSKKNPYTHSLAFSTSK